MDVGTLVSIGNFLFILIGAFIYWVREETLVKKVTETQGSNLKQLYLDQIDLKQKVDKHIEHHNEFKNKISIETGVMSNSMDNMKETLDKMEVFLKEFAIEVKSLVRESRK